MLDRHRLGAADESVAAVRCGCAHPIGEAACWGAAFGQPGRQPQFGWPSCWLAQLLVAQLLGGSVAEVGGVVSVSPFKDLPLAARDREWDGADAEKRIRAWAEAEDGPNQKYRAVHVWYDQEKKAEFGGYKLLIADIVDGEVVVVPRAVMAAGAIMDGSRGGIDLPENDIDRVKSHLAKYYEKMGDKPPWDR